MAAVPRNPTDWQLSCTSIKERGWHLLQSGQHADCTFLVGAEPNRVAFQGHKLILGMASPVFEAMFYGGIAERDAAILILDVQPEAFKDLLEYIYTDRINLTTFDKACELCYAAKKYMLPHLVKECTTYLWSDLLPKNACRAYEFAKLFEESVLMDKCLQIISSNTKEVIQDASFMEVELDTVIAVFSVEILNINSELDLFTAVERYAKALGKKTEEQTPLIDPPQQSPQPSTSKVVTVESSPENSPRIVVIPDQESVKPDQEPVKPDQEPVKPDQEPAGDSTCNTNTESANKILCNENKEALGNKVRGALMKIRFLTLTPQEFAEGPAKSSLLSESEAFAILMNILSTNSNLPMPEGFSASRVSRKQISVLTVDTPSPVEPARPAPGDSPRFLRTSVVNRASEVPYFNEFPGARSSLVQLPDVSEVSREEFHRVYCHRPLLHSTSCLNTSVLDCCLTFMVDKNICLLGVQVPTQAPEEGSGFTGSGFPGAGYSELLYAHLLDADGSRLTYTHYTNRVPYRHLLDIMFNRPVYIQRNKVYKVGLVLNKVGWYQMGTCARQVAAESVFFNFGIGNTNDCVRDGLIRSIIFTY